MQNTKMTQYATKTINKVNYTFVAEEVDDALNDTADEVTTKKQVILTRKTSKDSVIVEQPLQITLSWLEQGKVKRKVFTITMRTPGHDDFLIMGLLHSEGVIKQLQDVETIKLESGDVTGEGKYNEWLIKFTNGFIPDLSSLDRYMVSYSSCGLCGTTSLKTLQLKTDINLSYPEHKNILMVQSILLLSSKMRNEQGLFDQTGGVHGAALFDQELNIQQLYEDIGRHNAVDKVIGALLALDKSFQKAPLWILLVSGRISFEIVQKTIMAGISILVGVGAPSDLAIQAAKQFDLTLIGFASNKGFNVYHGDWRLTNETK